MLPAISAIRSGCCRCIESSPRQSRISNRFMESSKQFARAIGPYLFMAVAIALGLTVTTQHTDAHTPVTSKYDYNRDVFPLLRDHCAACHVAGGGARGLCDAAISAGSGRGLAVGQPESGPVAAPSGTALKLMPGSKIQRQLHYKKHFDPEQSAVADRSTVRLYFTDPPPPGRKME